MTSRHRVLPAVLVAVALTAAGGTALPAQAAGIAVPVQCETGAETVLAWDDVTYDLRGTCGVVRVSADHATVTMPTATRLVLEGTGNAVTAKPLYDVEVTGAGYSVTTPSVRSLSVTGAGTTVAVSGLVESAELASTSSSLTADVVNLVRLRGADAVTARKAYRTRITGSDNTVGLRRAGKVVLTGDRNTVTVARGRTTLRDRGADNVLDLRPRRRR
ncbi:DUF3060 domain-containing protein [uncultured Nocardioides sp.]|uniref:DUF3060 domain-containing protein n=1 Tax=uncultured Nocardioides sp. TaxID=198441 RepID=UPI0026234F68|nr:DUF3060 domain-containing protein [uncultured Nocardioides sp.]